MASPNKEDENTSAVKINLADFISCQCESSGSGRTVVAGPKESCGPNIDTISITITLQSRAPGAGAGAAAGVSRPTIQDVPSDKVLAKQDETIQDVKSEADTAGLDEETKDIFEDAELEQDKSDADISTRGGKSVRIDSKEDFFEDAEPKEGLYEETNEGDEELQGDKLSEKTSGDEITDSDVADGKPDAEDSTEESGAAEDELLELGEDVEEPVPGEESSEPDAQSALEDESLEPGAEQDESIEQEIDSEKQEDDSEEPEESEQDKDVEEEDRISTKPSTGSEDEGGEQDGLSEELSTKEGDEDAQEEDAVLSPQSSLTDKDEPSHKSMQVLGSQIDDELADHSVTDLVGDELTHVDDEEVEDATTKTEKDSDVSIQTYQTPIGSKADVMVQSRTSSKEMPKAKSSSEVESRRSSKIIEGTVPAKSESQIPTFQVASDESGELCENCECASSSELTTSGTESDVSKKPQPDSSDASKRRLPLTDSEASKRPLSDSVAFRQPLTDPQGGSMPPSQKSKPDGDSRTHPRGTVSETEEEELEEEGVCRPGLGDGILLKNVGGFIVLCIIIRTIRVVGGFFR